MDLEFERSRQGQIEKVGALADPVRRSLYELVIANEAEDLSRDQAADALGIHRGLAAFHLDKLVRVGLLEARFRRPPGIGGPGAGRPTKYYRRNEHQVEVSLPPRRYDLIGRFLMEGVSDPRAAGLSRARRVARRFGREVGSKARATSGTRRSTNRSVAAAIEVLKEYGFEPVHYGRHGIALRNCPFRALAVGHRDTVCQINLAMHEGLIEALGVPGIKAELISEPDFCCVRYGAPDSDAGL